MKIFTFLFVLYFCLQNAMAFHPKSPAADTEVVVNYVNALSETERFTLYENFFAARSKADQKWFAKNKDLFKTKIVLEADGKDVTYEFEDKKFTISDHDEVAGTIKFNGHEFNYNKMSMQEWDQFLGDHLTPKTSFLNGLLINEAHAEFFVAMALIAAAIAISSYIIGRQQVKGQAFEEETMLVQMQTIKYQCITATRGILDYDSKEKIATLVAQLKANKVKIEAKNKVEKKFTSGSFEIAYKEASECLENLLTMTKNGPVPLAKQLGQDLDGLKFLHRDCVADLEILNTSTSPNYAQILAGLDLTLKALKKIEITEEKFKVKSFADKHKEVSACLSEVSTKLTSLVQKSPAVLKAASRNDSERSHIKDVQIKSGQKAKPSANKQ